MKIGVPGAVLNERAPSRQFWILAAFLGLVFLSGGSARPDVQSLQILRPVSILLAAYAFYTMKVAHWHQYKHILIVMVLVVLLISIHLVPLPSRIWQQMAGRDIVREIDTFVGLRGNWRPLSMVPSATRNALFAMSVPVAVLGMATQLTKKDQVCLLGLMVIFAILSGTIGFIQAIGLDVRLYALSSEKAGLFANRNHQGVLLAMLFPMLGTIALGRQFFGVSQRLRTTIAASLASITIPLVIITGSRAGLIAALLAVALTLLFYWQSWFQGRTQKAGRGLAMSSLVVLMIGGLSWLTVTASRGTALERLEAAGNDVRYPVWKSVIDAMHVYMPWGSGAGSYADAYQILEPNELLRTTFSNHAHNEWLEIAFTTGLPGMALLIWAILLFSLAAKQAFRATGTNGYFSRLGLCLILLLAFASTVDYPLRTPIMASVFAVAAVWASSFRRFGNEDESD